MIVTPSMLWKDYDRRKLPLNVTELKNSQGEKTVYFNGEACANGCTRVFARLLSATKGKQRSPLFVIMSYAESDVEKGNYDFLTDHGYDVLAVDYAGDYGGHGRYTLYPRQLEYCNYSKENVLALPDNPRQSCWYTWTTVALRAFTYAESEGYEYGIFLGCYEGAAQVYKACFTETEFLRAGITVNPVGRESVPSTEDENYLAFISSLNRQGYAPVVKCPILQLLAANNPYGNADSVSDIYAARTRNDFLFSVSPRASRIINCDREKTFLAFTERYLLGKGTLPTAPRISVRGGENSLYYEINGNGSPVKPISCNVYVAYAMKNSTLRNWRNIPAESIGEDSFLCRVNAYTEHDVIYTFANLTYENGVVLSTEILSRTPASLGVKAQPFTKKRLIYDSDMGTDDWFCLHSDRPNVVVMQDGPYDITGVTGESGLLSTFKLGDYAFVGERDSVLQLLVYASVDQDIRLRITDRDTLASFECTRHLTPSEGWCKVNLSPADFKSKEKVFEDWEKVALLEIEFTGTVLVNSMLWV